MRHGDVRLVARRTDWAGRRLRSQAWPFRRLVGALLWVVRRALRGRLKALLFGTLGQRWPFSSNDWVVLASLSLCVWRGACGFSIEPAPSSRPSLASHSSRSHGRVHLGAALRQATACCGEDSK
eukprot:5101601-Pyramimonas_sp.AAC.1